MPPDVKIAMLAIRTHKLDRKAARTTRLGLGLGLLEDTRAVLHGLVNDCHRVYSVMCDIMSLIYSASSLCCCRVSHLLSTKREWDHRFLSLYQSTLFTTSCMPRGGTWRMSIKHDELPLFARKIQSRFSLWSIRFAKRYFWDHCENWFCWNWRVGENESGADRERERDEGHFFFLSLFVCLFIICRRMIINWRIQDCFWKQKWMQKLWFLLTNSSKH